MRLGLLSIVAAASLLATSCGTSVKQRAPKGIPEKGLVADTASLVVEFDDESKSSSGIKGYHVNIVATTSTTAVIFCDVTADESADCSYDTEHYKTEMGKRSDDKLIFRSVDAITLEKDKTFKVLSFTGKKQEASKETLHTEPARTEESDTPEITVPSQPTTSLPSYTTPNALPSQTPTTNDFPIGPAIAQVIGALSGQGGLPSGYPSSLQQPQQVPTTPVNGVASSDEMVPNPNNVPLNQTEFEIIRETNRARVQRGKSKLIVLASIMESSRQQSQIMLQKQQMEHGFTSGWRAENIARGQRNGTAAVNAWINSPGHFKNMMGSFQYIGVGEAGKYWTQQFK